jgi:hypothetical protein
MVPRQPFNEMKPNSGRGRAKEGDSSGENADWREVGQSRCAFIVVLPAFFATAGKTNRTKMRRTVPSRGT